MGPRLATGSRTQDATSEDETNDENAYRRFSKSRTVSSKRRSVLGGAGNGKQYEQLSGGMATFCDSDYDVNARQSLSKSVFKSSCFCCILCRCRWGCNRDRKITSNPVRERPVQLAPNDSARDGKLLCTKPEVVRGAKSSTDHNSEEILSHLPYCRIDGDCDDCDLSETFIRAPDDEVVIYCGKDEDSRTVSLHCTARSESLKRSGTTSSGFLGFDLLSRAFSRKSAGEDSINLGVRLLSEGDEIVDSSFSTSMISPADKNCRSLSESTHSEFDLSGGLAPIARFDSTLSEVSDVCDELLLKLENMVWHHDQNSVDEAPDSIHNKMFDDWCDSENNLNVIHMQRPQSKLNSDYIYDETCASTSDSIIEDIIASSTSVWTALARSTMIYGSETQMDQVEGRNSNQLSESLVLSVLDDISDCRSLLLQLRETLQQTVGDSLEDELAVLGGLKHAAVIEENIAYRLKIDELQQNVVEQRKTINELQSLLNSSEEIFH